MGDIHTAFEVDVIEWTEYAYFALYLPLDVVKDAFGELAEEGEVEVACVDV